MPRIKAANKASASSFINGNGLEELSVDAVPQKSSEHSSAKATKRPARVKKTVAANVGAEEVQVAKKKSKKNVGENGKKKKKQKSEVSHSEETQLNNVNEDKPSGGKRNSKNMVKDKAAEREKQPAKLKGRVKNMKSNAPEELSSVSINDELSIQPTIDADSMSRSRKKKEIEPKESNMATVTNVLKVRGKKVAAAAVKQEAAEKESGIIQENVEGKMVDVRRIRGGRKATTSSKVKPAKEIEPIVEPAIEKKVAKTKAFKEPKESKRNRAVSAKLTVLLTDAVKEAEVHDEIKQDVAVKARGRKRPVTKESVAAAGDGNDNSIDGVKPSKIKKKNALLNETDTKYNKSDFLLPPTEETDNEAGAAQRFNLKISSWNVAGLRSWLKKNGLQFLDYEEPDIFCMQETKCADDQLPEEVVRLPGYHPYWLCHAGGYAGVAIYSKIMPIHVDYGIGNKDFDDVGRMITAEYEKFYLINVYVPNSGRKLVNLTSRMEWETLFQAYVKKLDNLKPVIICGDMNVSHLEIDLANPKANTRNAGFTKEERDRMTELLALGFVDTFRRLYPNRTGAYTYWTYMANARARNVGWRLDYFIVSERFASRVVDNLIRSQCFGSDHCPITLFLKL